MIYADANIFLLALLDNNRRGEQARNLLRQGQDGERSLSTCALTYDEVVWNVKRYRDKKTACLTGKSFLEMQGLRILPVELETLTRAQTLMEKYSIRPRDAIHAGCCIANRIQDLLSEDKDFDKISEIKRRRLKELTYGI